MGAEAGVLRAECAVERYRVILFGVHINDYSVLSKIARKNKRRIIVIPDGKQRRVGQTGIGNAAAVGHIGNIRRFVLRI